MQVRVARSGPRLRKASHRARRQFGAHAALVRDLPTEHQEQATVLLRPGAHPAERTTRAGAHATTLWQRLPLAWRRPNLHPRRLYRADLFNVALPEFYAAT